MIKGMGTKTRGKKPRAGKRSDPLGKGYTISDNEVDKMLKRF